MERLTHAAVEELLGVYALDAVEADEAEEIERHLADCPRCRAEVREHREAAAMLAHAGADAPDGVWDRIAGSLVEPPPSLDMSNIVRLAPRRSVSVRVMAAVSAAAAVLIAVLGVDVVRQNHRIDRISAAVGRQSVAQTAAAASFEPGSRQVQLRGVDGAVLAGAVVTKDGRGFFTRGSLPALPSDQTYQLWGIVSDRTVSLGVFGPAPGVGQFEMVGDVTALAVTAEVAGGVPAPTKTPVAQGALAA